MAEVKRYVGGAFRVRKGLMGLHLYLLASTNLYLCTFDAFCTYTLSNSNKQR